MTEQSLKPWPRDQECPCGSGRAYGKCCRKKKIRFYLNKRGEIVREIPFYPELKSVFQGQEREFKKIFGRKPSRSDILFYGRFLSPESYSAQIRKVGRAAGVRDEILFATERTGLIVAEMNFDIVSDNDLGDWNNAIDEYFYFSEKGIDPYHVFTYLSHDDFEIYKRAISFLDDIIVICFSVMNRTKVTKDVAVQFHFLTILSALNSLRTIRGFFTETYDDDCLAILRGVYEQYLRAKYIRLTPSEADRLISQVKIALGEYGYRKRRDGSLDYNYAVSDDGENIKLRVGNGDIIKASDLPIEAEIYNQIYNELSTHVHHDVVLWILQGTLEGGLNLDRDRDSVRAIVFVSFVCLLLVYEMLRATYFTRRQNRDLFFLFKRLRSVVRDLITCDSINQNCLVPPAMRAFVDLPFDSLKL